MLRLLAALVLAATMTTPAYAAPGEAAAEFRQNLLHVPTHIVEGDLTFEDLADGKVQINGQFGQGFGSAEPTDFRWLLVDDRGEVVHDLTKEMQATIDVVPPEVAPFEIEYAAEVKDVLGLECVIFQVVNVAGVKLLAEIGRARVARS